jgi:Protein of unknown function (DUF3499)
VRTCSRIGCGALATASAVLRYQDWAVELIDLVRDPDPGFVDLCPAHAARLTPPKGWTMADLRVASAVPA